MRNLTANDMHVGMTFGEEPYGDLYKVTRIDGERVYAVHIGAIQHGQTLLHDEPEEGEIEFFGMGSAYGPCLYAWN